MDTYTFLVVFFVLAAASLDTAGDLLSLKRMDAAELPGEFRGLYDPERYRSSLQYQEENVRAELLQRTVMVALTLAFILGGGFDAIDRFARGFGLGSIPTGLLFVGALVILKGIVALPFSIHRIFGIEERYGFNRTTPRTFALDLLKGAILGIALGAPLFAAVQWFFEEAGPDAWWIAWLGITSFQVLLVFIAPSVLMPLFNRFSPLPEGELKRAIEEYARSERFRIQGVYTMDGSKRSSKANAFFAGYGPSRRLVLFDTLVGKQSVEELTAVVAHEIGHFKRGHILKSMALSIAIAAAMLYGVSHYMMNDRLFAAFRTEKVSVYAGLVFASYLAAPALRLLGILTHWMSRRFEFEADAYATRTYGKPEALVSALKKLSMDNLSNLTPHPLKVWLDYTHPPVLERIGAIRGADALRGGRA